MGCGASTEGDAVTQNARHSEDLTYWPQQEMGCVASGWCGGKQQRGLKVYKYINISIYICVCMYIYILNYINILHIYLIYTNILHIYLIYIYYVSFLDCIIVWYSCKIRGWLWLWHDCADICSQYFSINFLAAENGRLRSGDDGELGKHQLISRSLSGICYNLVNPSINDPENYHPRMVGLLLGCPH